MTNCPEYRELISSWSTSGAGRSTPEPIEEDRNLGARFRGETYRVIDNEQLRLGFGCQCRELFRRCVVLRYEGVETFRHLCIELESLRFVDQNITAITSLDRFLRTIGIA